MAEKVYFWSARVNSCFSWNHESRDDRKSYFTAEITLTGSYRSGQCVVAHWCSHEGDGLQDLWTGRVRVSSALNISMLLISLVYPAKSNRTEQKQVMQFISFFSHKISGIVAKGAQYDSDYHLFHLKIVVYIKTLDLSDSSHFTWVSLKW